jgi:hypothetical protein
MLNRENLMPDLDWEALWTVERWLNDSTLVVEVVTIWATFIPPACPGSPGFRLENNCVYHSGKRNKTCCDGMVPETGYVCYVCVLSATRFPSALAQELTLRDRLLVV